MSEYLYTPIFLTFEVKFTPKFSIRLKPNLSKEHTYIQVFNRTYESHLNILKKQPNIKILYETPYAINTHHGGQENRQKLVVWEFTDDEQVPPV